MDVNEIDEVIKKELSELNISDLEDISDEENVYSSEDDRDNNDDASSEIPESMLSYLEATRNRTSVLEKLIEDLEDDAMYSIDSSQSEDLLKQLAADFDEDSVKLKEQVLSEMESEELNSIPGDTSPPTISGMDSKGSVPPSNKDTDGVECDAYVEFERQLDLELEALESKLKEENERRSVEYQEEREKNQNEQRQKEEWRKRRQRDFEEELKRIEKANKPHSIGMEVKERETEEKLQKELLQHQEVISSLQRQMEEEMRVLEENLAEGKRRTQELRSRAAMKIQAALRGLLVRRWSRSELHRRREEKRRSEEEQRRRRETQERCERVREEERKRREKEDQELEKRRAEYKRAKEEERVRLEREHKLEKERREREEEEEKRRKEEERREREEEEKRKEEERREREEEEKRRKEVERREREEEEKRKEEERREREEEEKRRKEEERREREEEEKRKVEEERREREEEEKRKREEKEKRKKREEEEKKRREEMRKKGEEKRKRVEEEERRKREEEEQRKREEEEKRRKKEKRRNDLEERKNDEEERRKREEKKRVEEERRRNDFEERKNDEEERRKAEDDDRRNSEEVEKSKTIKPNPTQTLTRPRPPDTLNLTNTSPPHTALSESITGRALGLSPQKETLERESSIPKTVDKDSGRSFTTTLESEHRTLSSTITPNPQSMTLPEHTEQKRLGWMRDCTPWSKLFLQNKRKKGAAQNRRGVRRGAERSCLPPLCPDTLLQSGAWSSLQEVTTVTLEDLPGCSLSTLAQCPRLQALTLRRCGLTALDGLSQCSELCYIDVQENEITLVDCDGLVNLRVLRLGRNHLTSIHGLAGAVNLVVLELSYNCITRIGGLESLKRLQRLLIDHNQLISTKGLREAYLLLYLDCSYNHLSSVEGLEHCALLHTLDLRANNLTQLPSLRNQVLLRELHLEDNSISSLESLAACWLPLLQLLSGAQNSITQLPSLSDCVSLVKLDLSHNCLSEVENVCESLAGCTVLREVDLTGNPLQQEASWRSSLMKALPGLKDSGQRSGSSPPPPAGGVCSSTLPEGSFLAFCQAQLLQLRTLEDRHRTELSAALSPLEAQKMSCGHHDEVLQLAEQHRYAHEYGDTTVTDTHRDTSDTTPGKTTDMETIKRNTDEHVAEHPETKSSGKVPPSSPTRDINQRTSEKKLQLAADRPNFNPRIGSTRPELELAVNFHEETPTHAKPSREPIPNRRNLDLKNIAAAMIQRHWRRHRTWRRVPLVVHAEGGGGGEGERWRGGGGGGGRGRVDAGTIQTDHGCKDPGYAATVIQALWRGRALRKRLASALAAARDDTRDDSLEEVDVDEFVFDETVLERDWMSLLSEDTPTPTLPGPTQPPCRKDPVHLPVASQERLSPALQRRPRQAWVGVERAELLETRVTPESTGRTKSPASASGPSSLSERSEKLLEEWGFTDNHTAMLMLKRAQKMKSKKQRKRKLLDPSVRLALFRNHSNQHVPIQAPKKPSADKRVNMKARDAEPAPQEEGQAEQARLKQQRTYQWLHTQAVRSHSRADEAEPSLNQQRADQWLPAHSYGHPDSHHFLPEIDPDVLNGGRVQLVAAAGSREELDQAPGLQANATTVSLPHREHNEHRRNSGENSKKEVPSPTRVTSTPSKKERMSFRDNPVQMSGGWGGGKKRDKVCK